MGDLHNNEFVNGKTKAHSSHYIITTNEDHITIAQIKYIRTLPRENYQQGPTPPQLDPPTIKSVINRND